MRLLIFSLSLLLSLDIFGATELLRTIKPSGQGGDYTSLSAWEAATQKDLVASDEFAVAEIDGDWSGGADTTAVTISGWTTDATRYIEIRTTTAARHTGKWDASKYMLAVTNPGNMLNITEDFVRVVGVQLQLTTTSAQAGTAQALNASALGTASILIDKCIARGVIAADSGNFIRSGIRVSDADATFEIRNCVAFGFTAGSANTSRAFYVQAGVANLLNCTAYGSEVGFAQVTSTVTTKNCLAQSCTDGFNGTFEAASTNNASDIASDAPGTSPQTGTITFTDAANGDFGLVSGVAIANGADLSGTFTDDLAGVTRTVPWDIGARKYVAAGGGMVLLPTGLLQ